MNAFSLIYNNVSYVDGSEIIIIHSVKRFSKKKKLFFFTFILFWNSLLLKKIVKASEEMKGY